MILFEKKEFWGLKYLWFDDLEIPHLDTAGGEIRNLKLDRDGSLPFTTLMVGSTHATAKPTRHATTELIVALDAR